MTVDLDPSANTLPLGGDAAAEVGPFTAASRRFLQRIDAEVSARAPAEIVRRIEDLVSRNDRWRSACLNLNPAEGLMSRRARALLDSDMASRLTEGVPGDKTFPHFRLNAAIDEIEATIIALARQLFGAAFVEWRPVSTSMANAAVFHALLKPGDAILVQGMEGGGNFSYQRSGPAGLAGLVPHELPAAGPLFEIDLDRLRERVRTLRPRMIVVGGSKVLFPYPLAEIRRIADEVEALVLFDAAHLGLLISAPGFQRPLQEGAHVLTLSTHKQLGGPVGGMVLTDDPAIASRISSLTFPGLLQTRDQNKYAALAVALAEARAFGAPLSERMVANAQALGQALASHGYDVLGASRGFTRTHQLVLRLGERAQTFEASCQAANIVVPDCALTGDIALRRRTGIRAGTHELSRLGFAPGEMAEVASLIVDADRSDRPPSLIAVDVHGLLERHPSVAASFDGESA